MVGFAVDEDEGAWDAMILCLSGSVVRFREGSAMILVPGRVRCFPRNLKPVGRKCLAKICVITILSEFCTAPSPPQLLYYIHSQYINLHYTRIHCVLRVISL